MNPYSHYLLASKVAPIIRPARLDAYYLGSIIPDIRYLAGMRRAQTHISREQIRQYHATYPHLESFLQGFQVHCLIDEIDLVKVASSTFPFNFFKRALHKSFSQKKIAVLVELNFMQSTHMGWNIAENHNEVLTDLGITPAQTETYLQAMKEYLTAPSFETALSCFQKIGWLQNARSERYLQAYQSVENHRLLKAFLLMMIRNMRLDRVVVKYVRTAFA